MIVCLKAWLHRHVCWCLLPCVVWVKRRDSVCHMCCTAFGTNLCCNIKQATPLPFIWAHSDQQLRTRGRSRVECKRHILHFLRPGPGLLHHDCMVCCLIPSHCP